MGCGGEEEEKGRVGCGREEEEKGREVGESGGVKGEGWPQVEQDIFTEEAEAEGDPVQGKTEMRSERAREGGSETGLILSGRSRSRIVMQRDNWEG